MNKIDDERTARLASMVGDFTIPNKEQARKETSVTTLNDDKRIIVNRTFKLFDDDLNWLSDYAYTVSSKTKTRYSLSTVLSDAIAALKATTAIKVRQKPNSLKRKK